MSLHSRNRVGSYGLALFFLYKKSMCSYGTHTSKCYPQPDLGYIFKQYVHSRIHIQSTKCPSVTDTFIL